VVKLKIKDQELNDVKLVIFDRDGTLIDLYHYWSQMIGKRAELICRKFHLDGQHKEKLMYVMGIDTKNAKIRADGPVGIKKREIVMQAAIDYLGSIGMKDGYQACIEAFAEVDELSRSKLAELIKPLDGMCQMIDALIQKGCKIAIATTDKTERARLSMEYLRLTDKVDFVVGADGVKNSKPAPDMIDLILQDLKIDKANTVMVGDAETDIQMGINAGVLASIAVCSGITPCERLEQLTEHVIADISKIKVI
jgi:phosphoglycolate phosphatase